MLKISSCRQIFENNLKQLKFIYILISFKKENVDGKYETRKKWGFR